MSKFSLVILALLATSACGANSGWNTPLDSRFVTPAANGEIVELDEFFGNQPQSMISAVTGNSYSYAVDFNPDLGVRAYAGIVPGAKVSAQPASNTVATMTGDYRVEYKAYETATSNNIQLESQTLTGGKLTLQADFGNGTLIGKSDGSNDLRVNGQFSGKTLTGTTSYRGVSGSLQGLVGGNEAIGVFQGHNSKELYAGGFIVN